MEVVEIDNSYDAKGMTCFSFEGREGCLVEIVFGEEDVGTTRIVPSTTLLVCRKKPTGKLFGETAIISRGAIGMFLENSAPFMEPTVLIGTDLFVIGKKHLKEIKR